MPEKKTLVILHGWNLSSVKFIPLKKRLEKLGYRVLIPDLPGFGHSRPIKKPQYLKDYATFVRSYFKRHKLSDPIIIGHSFGGRIAVKLAATGHDGISNLILTGTPGFLPIARLKVLFFLLLAKTGKLLFSLPLLNRYQDLTRRFLYRLGRASDFYHTKENMRQTFQNIVAEKLADCLNLIKIPTLLIWGEHDAIVPLHVAHKMEKAIIRSQLKVVKGARHGVPWTHPAVFASLSDRFIRENA